MGHTLKCGGYIIAARLRKIPFFFSAVCITHGKRETQQRSRENPKTHRTSRKLRKGRTIQFKPSWLLLCLCVPCREKGTDDAVPYTRRRPVSWASARREFSPRGKWRRRLVSNAGSTRNTLVIPRIRSTKWYRYQHAKEDDTPYDMIKQHAASP